MTGHAAVESRESEVGMILPGYTSLGWKAIVIRGFLIFFRGSNIPRESNRLCLPL